MRIEFYRHALDEKDIESAAATLKSLFLTTGPVCEAFEERFARYTGLRHCVSLSSCTAALHLALLALGIGPGDEVITTPMTFIATATSILHTGATPVFADVEPRTGLLTPESAAAAITPRTKAILPVHLYGAMADMLGFRALADRHGLALVEDAAHCVEGERDGVRPGTLSDAVCYSFYATKNLTCGEGGALCANSADLAGRVRLLRQHGMNKEAAKRYHGPWSHWDMVELGWKCNLSDILAALLLHQIDRLDGLLSLRRAVWADYSARLADVPQVRVPEVCGESACHLFTVQVPRARRDALLAHLSGRGVGVAVNYRAIHTLTWFREHMRLSPEDYPVALAFGEGTVSLPFYPSLPAEALEQVVGALRGFDWGADAEPAWA